MQPMPNASRGISAIPRFLGLGILNMVLTLSLLIIGTPVGWVIVFLLWFDAIVYCWFSLRERALLAGFLVSFFVFLLGRQVLINVFKYRIEVNDPKGEIHLQLSLAIALASLLIFYIIVEKMSKKPVFPVGNLQNSARGRSITSAASVVFFVSLAVAFLSVSVRALFVLRYGYVAKNIEYYSAYLPSHPIWYVADKVEQIANVSFWILLGSLPPKRTMRIAIPLYLLYLTSTLVTGQRTIFTTGCMAIGIYLISRYGLSENRQKTGIKYILLAIVAIPLVTLLLSWVANWRGLGGGGDTPIQRMLNFVYDQGVSSRVIYNAYVNHDSLPTNLNPLLEWTRTGWVARLLGYTVNAGNTVDHALDGSSFTHALGYTILPDSYLQGDAPGTSFVAEFYFQGGFPLLVIGCGVLAFLLQRCCQLDPKRPVLTGIKIAVMPTLLFMPRGAVSSPLTFWLAPSTLATVGFVVLLSAAVQRSVIGELTTYKLPGISELYQN